MYIYNRLDHDQSSILKRVTLGLSAKMLRMIFSGGQGFGASVPAGVRFVDKVRGKVSWQKEEKRTAAAQEIQTHHMTHLLAGILHKYYLSNIQRV